MLRKVWWALKSVYITGAWGNSPEFYKKYGQKGHNGIDLRAAVGTPVYASDDGTILFEGWGKNHSWMGTVAGISVIIDHGTFYTGYAHMSRTIIDKGMKVKRGQLIGYSGATGGVTGAHLHWETLPKPPAFGNGYAGRVNPSTIVDIRAYGTLDEPPLQANQRKTGALRPNVRTEPHSNAPIAQEQLKANTVYNIDGWVTGERLGEQGWNLWYKVGKGFAWCGGFTTQTTTGLPEYKPEPVVTTQRVTEKEAIQFETRRVNTLDLPEGEEKVKTEGKVGEIIRTIEITITDGKETGRRVVDTKITEPVHKVIMVGTFVAPVVTVEEVSEVEVLPYEAVRFENPELLAGDERIVQAGVNGYIETIYKVTFTDGVETSRVLADTIRVEPVEEISEFGTHVEVSEPEPTPIPEPAKPPLTEVSVKSWLIILGAIVLGVIGAILGFPSW